MPDQQKRKAKASHNTLDHMGEGTGMCLPPEQMTPGSSRWAMAGQGYLGNGAVLERLGDGGYNADVIPAAAGFGVGGRGPGISGGFGMDMLYASRMQSQGGWSRGGGGGSEYNMGASFTPLGAQGIRTHQDLFGLQSNLSGDAALHQAGFTGGAQYDPSGRLSGFNGQGSYTPYTARNVDAGINAGPFGQLNAGFGEGYYGRHTAGLNTSTLDDGTIRSDATYSYRHGIENAHLNSSNALGTTNLQGSFGTGPQYQGWSQYNPETGSGELGGRYAGGGYAFSNAELQGNYLGGNLAVNGSMGEFSTANAYEGAAGWDAERRQAYARGMVSTGNTLTDTRLGTNIGNGAMTSSASLGEWRHGLDIEGEARIGADGLTASGSGRGGGHRFNDLQAESTLGDFYRGRSGLQHASNDLTVQGGHFDLNGSGLNTGFDQLRASDGIRLQGLSTEQELFGQSFSGSVGEISNDTILEGGNLGIDSNGLNMSLDRMRTGGLRMQDAQFNQSLLGTDSNLSVGEVSNDILLEGAYSQMGLTSGRSGFDKLDGLGIRVQDVAGDFNNETLGVNGNYGLEGFGNGFTMEGVNSSYDLVNDPHLRMSADRFAGFGFDVNGANYNVNGPGNSNASGSLESFHTGLGIDDASMSLDSNGFAARAGHADWNTLSGRNLDMSGNIGDIYQSRLHAGEGYFNRFSGDNINLTADSSGVGLSGQNLGYDYLGFQDVSSEQSIAGGALGTTLNMGSGELGSVDIGDFGFHTNGLNSQMSMRDARATGLELRDTNIGTNVGDAGANVGLGSGTALDLSIGDARSETSMMGLAGNGEVRDANLDILQLDDAHAGVSWNGQEVAGARADINSSLGVNRAEGEWDLTSGTASGRFEEARMGQQLSDASINFMGNELALPDAGFDVRASGGGEADILAGEASGDISLAGSSVNFAGHELTAPEWARASGEVDLGEGAVSTNVGGSNGVGVDASIAEGNLDVNLFGNHIDIDEGVSDAAEWVGDTASSAASTVSSAASSVGKFFSSLW